PSQQVTKRTASLMTGARPAGTIRRGQRGESPWRHRPRARLVSIRTVGFPRAACRPGRSPTRACPRANVSPPAPPSRCSRNSPPAPAVWHATHVVSSPGVRTWAEPNPALAPGTTLDAGLQVQVVEQRTNGWAHVVCSNGWSAWVDGRRLQAVGARPIQPVTPAG